jgi:NitT/TauT family transport system substrate-binding protein
MKKIIALLVSVLLLVSLLTACGKQPESTSGAPVEKANVSVVAIAGPTGVGLVNLMENGKNGTAANNYTFTVVNDPQQAVAAVVNKSANIAAVPTNLASTLYKKTGGNVQVLAVNTLGVLSILENGDSIQSVADLRGKTIYTSGQGANPEYILRYVLEKNGINPDKDVKIEFVADNDTLGTLVINGTAKVAMVPEPKATAALKQNAAVKRVLNMTEEWGKVSGDTSTLMMGCVVARKEFVQENPDAVKKFLDEYKASINAVKADVPAAAELCVTHGIIPKAPIAQAAIPNCNLTYVDGSEMKTQLSGYLKVLFDYNPAAIGGAMPADDFYYAG